ncbi:MBOAT family O-acyltransferase [Rhodopirellula sp. SWK7]|uniref:MBOAT family O-acyltransferase n=1 Tax=Rhodopirellula sp. SWK7 TaxID=595460 RepID=UPI0002BE5C08|nr:MBOAT family protein [Rhodopirellula sp. SWK7]EMI41491.1 membrane bound O-acyl transferase MBOAT family protein [Rhodopirellula sp. SWK7]
MNFAQAEFLIFLCVVLVVAWTAGANDRRIRNGFLLAASYYFYAYWDYRFCGLLLISTLVDFFVARRMSSCTSPHRRKGWLIVSLMVNLGMLGFFKYFNFFLDTARPLIESLGGHAGTLNVILPVGISFFTFQTLSYTIDVYRGKLRPTSSLLDFALYVAFFPQLVAGPIVRATNLLPQLAEVPEFRRRMMYGGFQQLLRGAVKKILIADRLAETVDVVFAGVELYSSVSVWIAVIAYAGQIYYDFSGYSDMAIGIAKMLGYRFPVNFRHPYLATSMSEFWRRWHITLSTWLRDYLYIPLGGSRGSSFATQRNLMITMTLGGLWHGAAVTYVLWGLWHGAALVIERYRRAASRLPRVIRSRVVRWFLVMTVVLMGWVLFRSPDWTTAMQVYQRLWMPWLSVAIDGSAMDVSAMSGAATDGVGALGETARIVWLPPLTLLMIAIMVIEHAVWTTRLRRCMRLPPDAWYSGVATAMMIWSLLLYAPRGFRPFVYFQF